MKVLSISGINPRKSTTSNKQVESCNVSKVNFTAAEDKTLENLIVKNTFSQDFVAIGRNISPKLNKLLENLKVLRLESYGSKEAVVTGLIPTIGNTYKPFSIKVNRNDFEHFHDISTGYAVGKGGVVASINTPEFTDLLLGSSSCETNGIKLFSELDAEHDDTIDDVDKLLNKKTTDKVAEKSSKAEQCPQNPSDSVAFKGDLHVYTHFKPEKTRETISMFNKFLRDYCSEADFAQHAKNMKEVFDHFDCHQLAGGLGTRLEFASDVGSGNKPSTPIAARHARLANMTQYNFFNAGLISGKKEEIHYHHFDKDLGPVVCFLASHGYKLQYENGISLVKDSNSKPLDPNKFHIIGPADNLSDIQLIGAAKECWKHRDDVGMMVVGVPDERAYGGLIITNDNNNKYVVSEFVSKEDKAYMERNDKEAYIKNYLKIEANQKKVMKHGMMDDRQGNKKFVGNAFIYFINPEIADTLVAICNKKIKNAAQKFMEENHYTSTNQISEDERRNIIECLWDREIIPELVKKSNQGELFDKKEHELKVYTYKASCDWSDVGQLNSFFQTNIRMASENEFTDLPKQLKEAMRQNIVDTPDGGKIVFLNGTSETREAFEKRLPNAKITGNHLVIGKGD